MLGWSESCIATNPSDFCVPLVALDAVVEIEGKAGRREVPLAGFHRLPGDAPERESVLEPGELIVAVRLPAGAAAFSAHARYLKVRERTSYAFAVVSAAAALRLENNTIVEARIALGGVALKPWRARPAEEMLAGAGLNLVDFWYRQVLPKNTIAYPNFRLFERLDQCVTEYTPLRYFATNIEFVSVKPQTDE